MGWAKYEEDNREAYTDRYTSGSYYWTPYQTQTGHRSDCYFGYCKTETIRISQAKRPQKKHAYIYSY